jgi:hypothetical protein
MGFVNRLAVCLLAGLLVGAAGCGNSELGGGPCQSDDPLVGCGAECAVDTDCSDGLYCTDDGACTADCTVGGGECGAGMRCTDRGRCEIDPTAGGDGGSDCPGVAVNLTPQTPTVILLIDQSGSMNDPFGNTNRWEAVKTALIDPSIGAVTQLEDRVIFGASLYSSINGNAGGACPLLEETAPALNNLANISALINAQSPREDTPTAEAVTAVAAGFPLPDPEKPGPRAIVLATDGNPDTCVDPDAHDQASRDGSEAAVAAAYADGISTYVLSVGDQVLQSHLDNLADIGVGAAPGSGVGTAYVANNPAELVDAFNEIIRGTRTCELEIDGTVDPNQADSGVVELNGSPLDYGTDWRLIDDDTLELLGDACDTFLAEDNVLLTAEFPCGSVVL